MYALHGINTGIWWSSWLRELAIYVHAIGLNLELYLPSANPHLHLFQTVWVSLQSPCPVHQMPALLVETVPQGRLIAENRHNQHFWNPHFKIGCALWSYASVYTQPQAFLPPIIVIKNRSGGRRRGSETVHATGTAMHATVINLHCW